MVVDNHLAINRERDKSCDVPAMRPPATRAFQSRENNFDENADNFRVSFLPSCKLIVSN